MQEPPRSVDPERLAAVLRRCWALDGTLEHLPVGFGSHHWRLDVGARGVGSGGEAYFVTVDELGHRPFLGPDPTTALSALSVAATAVHALSEAGLHEAVAPVVATDGTLVVPLDTDHAVWLHPWVSGTSGDFGEHLEDVARGELLAALARLHATQVTVPLRGVPMFPERLLLERLLRASSAEPAAALWPRRAQAWLSEHRESVLRRVAALDRVEGAVSTAVTVVTHGEPHPGNLLWTDEGMRIIDWDTVASAPRERDVWLAATDGGDVERYEDLAGVRLDRTLLRAYHDAWQLSDVASYADDLLRAADRPEGDADVQLAWRVLQAWADEE